MTRGCVPGAALFPQENNMSQTAQRTLRVTSSLDSFPQVTQFVEEAMDAVEVPKRARMDILLALDEVCTNILQYAYEGDPGPLALNCFCEDGDMFVLETEDQGAPFDPDAVEEPDLSASLEDRTVGGLGLFIVRKVMTEVQYSRDEQGRNRWRLAKRFK